MCTQCISTSHCKGYIRPSWNKQSLTNMSIVLPSSIFVRTQALHVLCSTVSLQELSSTGKSYSRVMCSDKDGSSSVDCDKIRCAAYVDSSILSSYCETN